MAPIPFKFIQRSLSLAVLTSAFCFGVNADVLAQSSQDRFRGVEAQTGQETPSGSNSLPSRFTGQPGQRQPAQPSSDNGNVEAPFTPPKRLTSPNTPTAPSPSANNASEAQPTNQEVEFFDENPGIDNLFSDKEYLSKVSPKEGSKFVVVEKNAAKGDQGALLEAARRARQLGRYEAALDFYNRILKKNSADKVILLERAVTLQSLGRYESAIAAYNKVLDVDPKNLKARINMLGLVRDRYPAVALQKMLELYEENPDVANLPAQIGLTYAGQGDYDNAKRYLGVALSLDPSNANHVFNMAILEDRKGNKKAALALYEKALELDTISLSSRKLPREKIYDRLAILRQRG